MTHPRTWVGKLPDRGKGLNPDLCLGVPSRNFSLHQNAVNPQDIRMLHSNSTWGNNSGKSNVVLFSRPRAGHFREDRAAAERPLHSSRESHPPRWQLGELLFFGTLEGSLERPARVRFSTHSPSAFRGRRRTGVGSFQDGDVTVSPAAPHVPSQEARPPVICLRHRTT